MEALSTRIEDVDSRIVVHRQQDVEPILEEAKRAHVEGDHGSADMRLAAEIPFVLVEAYCARYGLSFSEFQRDPAHIRAMLNDPALKAFRVWPGRV